jgi:transglutaminase-like putative cysteine protease
MSPRLRCLPCAVLLSLLLWPASGGDGYRATEVTQAGQDETDKDAILLEETMEIEVRSLTDARLHYSKRTQVLTPRGVQSFDRASVFYEPGVVVKDLRGWVTPPDGKKISVKKQAIVDGAAFASFELYSDSRHRTILFPGVVPGATVEYSYDLEIRNLFQLPRFFDLQETIPARQKMLVVSAPASLPLDTEVRGGSPQYTREEHGGVVLQRWTVRDVAALPHESHRPPDADMTPRIQIAPREIQWADHHIDAAHWNGIARFYWELARERMDPTPEVAQTSVTQTAGLTDPNEKTRRLYEYVRDKVNYVAISLDIGGWQPHSNGDVLHHLYGDCKDKATLLIAMLRATGLGGLPVLARTRDAGLVPSDIPSLSFNHAFVAIPREQGYLFLDPTSDAPYGDLPWLDQGINVLVVRADGTGEFTTTPLFPANRNLSRRTVEATLGSSGDLEGTLTIEAHGRERDELMPLTSGRVSERQDAVEDLVAWLCPGARLLSHDVKKPEDPTAPLVVTARFSVPHFTTRAGALEVVSPQIVRFPSLTSLATYPSRLQPFFFHYLFALSSEVRLRLPPGRTLRKLPSPHSLQGPGLSSTVTYEMGQDEGDTVLITHRTIEVTQREIPVDQYAALRDFVAGMVEDEARGVTLQIGG